MEKKSRVMDVIAEKEQKNHVILKYLLVKPIKIRLQGLEQDGYISEVIPGTDHIILELTGVYDFTQNPSLILSAVLARYIELQCTFVKRLDGTRLEIKVDKVSIAKIERAAPRFPVNEEGYVKVTHIVSSKTIIEANMFNIPTLVRVSFDEYKKKLSQELGANDIISVDIFKGSLERKFEVVKNSMKILLIEDCYKESSYEMDESDFVNYVEDIDDQLEPIIKKYKDKQVLSEIILPIIYVNEMDENIPIGYIWIENKESHLTREKVAKLISLTKEMVERIKDANLMTTDDKFPVVDISLTGLRIRINNANLIETLPKQKGFAFDVVFKMQTPFRIFATVAWSRIDPSGELLLGVTIMGKSRNASEKNRFAENLEMLNKLNSIST